MIRLRAFSFRSLPLLRWLEAKELERERQHHAAMDGRMLMHLFDALVDLRLKAALHLLHGSVGTRTALAGALETADFFAQREAVVEVRAEALAAIYECSRAAGSIESFAPANTKEALRDEFDAAVKRAYTPSTRVSTNWTRSRRASE